MLALNLLFWCCASYLVASQCVYTATECTCAQQPAGDMCLRYFSGAAGSEQCEAYECGSGYTCDCKFRKVPFNVSCYIAQLVFFVVWLSCLCLAGTGTEVCDVTDCTALREVYRPADVAPSTVGEVVGCEQATQVTCVSSRLISPSSTPSATPSVSIIPGPSSTSSSTPSVTPSISPSASIIPVALGNFCDETSICVAGAACNCLNVCATVVTINVEAIGDDMTSPWMCGNEFGSQTTDWQTPGSWTYTGPCSDLYMELTNTGGSTSIQFTIQDDSTGTWYPAKLSGGLSVITEYNPPDTSFFTDASYDFSGWDPAINTTSVADKPSWISFKETHNTDLMSWFPTEVGPFTSVSWYKVTLPFC